MTASPPLPPAHTRRRLSRNRMGWVSLQLSQVSRECVASCGQGMALLDLGAGFGAVAQAAAAAGAVVTVNDLDAAHLVELRRHPEFRVVPGHFPRQVEFADESFHAIHSAGMFHFLNRKELPWAARSITRWLRPGGRLFVVAASPYQAPFAAFVPEYERRVAAADPWPGWVTKISRYSTHKKISLMPSKVHLLDDVILRRECEAAGLVVDRAWLHRRDDLSPSMFLDGRESVGLIARKP